MKKLLATALFLAACGPAAPAAHGPINDVPKTVSTEPSVRTVDWANRTYDMEDGGPYTVSGGELDFAYDEDGNVVANDYQPKDPDGYVDHGFFSVSTPIYGDVTGDGVEEALIVTAVNEGGTAIVDQLEVYDMKDGKPHYVASIPGGDRGEGGIIDLQVDFTTVVLDRGESQDGDGVCCPSKVQVERWTWNGTTFVEDASARHLEDTEQ
jgi:hypothetical protein